MGDIISAIIIKSQTLSPVLHKENWWHYRDIVVTSQMMLMSFNPEILHSIWEYLNIINIHVSAGCRVIFQNITVCLSVYRQLLPTPPWPHPTSTSPPLPSCSYNTDSNEGSPTSRQRILHWVKVLSTTCTLFSFSQFLCICADVHLHLSLGALYLFESCYKIRCSFINLPWEECAGNTAAQRGSSSTRVSKNWDNNKEILEKIK